LVQEETLTREAETRVAVVTGASSGIGAAAARRLASHGWTVVAVGRSPQRTAAIAAELGTEPIVADFGRLEEVRAAANTILARLPRIDVLANNAGGIVPQRTMSCDGHELTFQSNHLAGYLLTRLLLPRLEANPAGARVIATSSFGNMFARVRLNDLEWEHRRYGHGWLAYSAAKLMNILTTRELARRHPALTAVAFHPEPGKDAEATPPRAERDTQPTAFGTGTPQLSFVRRIPGLRTLGLTGDRGAQPLVWLATSPRVAGMSGSYFDGMRAPGRMNRQARDEHVARELWETSERLVAHYL
jgi:NAD(P)-dependent dehydrogenase (short-subunit alcohol dehydrogenase family)